MAYTRRYRKRYFKRGNRTKKVITSQSKLVEKPSFPLRMANYALRHGARTGNSLYALAKSVQKISSMINTDLKRIQPDFTAQTVSSTPQFTLLNGIAQGTDEDERIGNQILVKDLDMKLVVTKNGNSSLSLHRFVLLVDKEGDGVVPTAAQIFQTANYMISPFNEDNRDRFVILRDWRFPLWTERPATMFKYYAKIMWHCHYTGATSALGDTQNNAIYLVRISDQATNTSVLDLNSKLQYYDN